MCSRERGQCDEMCYLRLFCYYRGHGILRLVSLFVLRFVYSNIYSFFPAFNVLGVYYRNPTLIVLLTSIRH